MFKPLQNFASPGLLEFTLPAPPELLVLEFNGLLTHSGQEGPVMAHHQQRLTLTAVCEVLLH
jgi:hypothetical protein